MKFLEQEEAARRLLALADIVPPNATRVHDEFFVTDMAQVEAKISAMFADQRDLHREKAAELFKKPPSEVTAEERRAGKSANFYELYGGEPK